MSLYTFIHTFQLLISPEQTNFVCATCESNLSQNAIYVHEIKQNAKNWDIFLKRDNSSNGQLNCNPMLTEEIKIEECDVDNFDNTTDTEICDLFDPSLIIDEQPIEIVDIQTQTPLTYPEILNDNAIVSTPKRKRINRSEQSLYHPKVTTEYERTCKLCNEPTFSSMRRFYIHLREQHPGEKTFTCDICGTKLTTKDLLYTHMRDRHSGGGRKHQCQFCAKLFFSVRELVGHEKIHLNVRSYVCKLCGKAFNQKTILNNHLKSKVHNADYKSLQKKSYKLVYRCELCVPSVIFKTSDERAIHKNRVHRTFECDICKNSFMAKESLDSHKLRHSDKPRKFVCTVSILMTQVFGKRTCAA